VVAAANSKEVVSYISQNTNAIGFVGSSWVGDFDDPEQVNYKNKIRFALIECINCEKGVYAKPSPATIAAGQYPLVRPLYFILKENTNGLGTGFVNYLSLERGQLVFRRSYLVPAKMSFGIRKTMIENAQ
jgi:phosphate transport system substrate-binding protein